MSHFNHRLSRLNHRSALEAARALRRTAGESQFNLMLHSTIAAVRDSLLVFVTTMSSTNDVVNFLVAKYCGLTQPCAEDALVDLFTSNQHGMALWDHIQAGYDHHGVWPGESVMAN